MRRIQEFVLRICIFLSLIILALTDATKSKSEYHECKDEERQKHPHLCNILDRAIADPIGLANLLHKWSRNVGYAFDMRLDQSPFFNSDGGISPKRQLLRAGGGADKIDKILPTVLAHGMGDSCFNSGFKQFTSHISSLTSSHAECIPTGTTQHTDTINGFFLNMDASVDVVASQIQSNPLLKDGFNAIGLSQGNNVIRGYIAKYNDPPVHTFLSLNGVNGGTGAVPSCIPKSTSSSETESIGKYESTSICNLLMEVASNRAYTTFAQTHSFQANYWRDPRPQEKEAYAKYSQLAQWNNEGRVYNSTLNENFAKTKKFVWVMALHDTMVWPKEGEQWGAPDPLDPFEGDVLDRNETEWYVKDLFGLRTAEEAGKNYYEVFDGPHLGFSMEDLDGWVKKYLIPES